MRGLPARGPRTPPGALGRCVSRTLETACRNGGADCATDLRVGVESRPEREDSHQGKPVVVLECLPKVVDVHVDFLVDRAEHRYTGITRHDERDPLVFDGSLAIDESPSRPGS